MVKIKRHVLVVNERSDLLRRLENALAKEGLFFRYAEDEASALEAIEKRKPHILLVSDFGPVDCFSFIRKILSSVETRNIRQFMLTKKMSETTTMRALQLGIRDVIPRNLGEQRLLDRILFASKANDAVYPEDSSLRFCDNARLTLSAFGKVVSLSIKRVVIESPVIIDSGKSIVFEVAELAKMGLIRATVVESRQQELTYNLMRSTTANLALNSQQKEFLQDWIQKNQLMSIGRKTPIFLALSQKGLRRQLIDRFAKYPVRLRFAWTRSTVFQEPRYVSPLVIVIEDRFITEASSQDFLAMLEDLGNEVTFVVNRISNEPWFDDFIAGFAGIHKIMVFDNLTADRIVSIVTELVQPKQGRPRNESGTIFIPENNPVADCFIKIQGVLTGVSDERVALSSTVGLARFGTYRLTSSDYAKQGVFPVFIKVIDGYMKARINRTHVATQFAGEREFFYEAIFLNLSPDRSEKLKKLRFRKMLAGNEALVQTLLEEISEAGEVKKSSRAIKIESWKPEQSQSIDREVVVNEIHEELEENEHDLAAQMKVSEVEDRRYIHEEVVVPKRKLQKKAPKKNTVSHIFHKISGNHPDFSVRLARFLAVIFAILLVLFLLITLIAPVAKRSNDAASEHFTAPFRKLYNKNKR